jgi:hypothetical protein
LGRITNIDFARKKVSRFNRSSNIFHFIIGFSF